VVYPTEWGDPLPLLHLYLAVVGGGGVEYYLVKRNVAIDHVVPIVTSVLHYYYYW